MLRMAGKKLEAAWSLTISLCSCSSPGPPTFGLPDVCSEASGTNNWTKSSLLQKPSWRRVRQLWKRNIQLRWGRREVSEVWSMSDPVTGKQNQDGGFRGRWGTRGSGQSIVNTSPWCLKKSEKSKRADIWNSTEGAKARWEMNLEPHHGFWAKIWTLWIWRLEALKSFGQESDVNQPLHMGECSVSATVSSHSPHTVSTILICVSHCSQLGERSRFCR